MTFGEYSGLNTFDNAGIFTIASGGNLFTFGGTFTNSGILGLQRGGGMFLDQPDGSYHGSFIQTGGTTQMLGGTMSSLVNPFQFNGGTLDGTLDVLKAGGF